MARKHICAVIFVSWLPVTQCTITILQLGDITYTHQFARSITHTKAALVTMAMDISGCGHRSGHVGLGTYVKQYRYVQLNGNSCWTCQLLLLDCMPSVICKAIKINIISNAYWTTHWCPRGRTYTYVYKHELEHSCFLCKTYVIFFITNKRSTIVVQ